MDSTLDSSQTRLRLADHVRACRVDGRVVLLDLRRGRYIGIDGRQAQLLLGSAIDGWPAGDAGCQATTPEVRCAGLLRPLLAQGLLTRDVSDSAPVFDIEEPARSLDLQAAGASTNTTLRDLCRLLQAAAVARVWLRWRSMHAIANAVAARRAKTGTRGDAMSTQALHRTMSTYDKLRPLVFTARDQCLFDSLTLMNFLAGERLFPRWVVGVKASPFQAHSWVQWGDLVLNDQHQNVQRFRPILVV